MSDGIRPDQFESYESCILSGQVPAEEVPALLDDKPAFAGWYRERAARRAKRHEGVPEARGRRRQRVS